MFSNIDLSPFLGAFCLLTLFNLQGTLPLALLRFAFLRVLAASERNYILTHFATACQAFLLQKLLLSLFSTCLASLRVIPFLCALPLLSTSLLSSSYPRFRLVPYRFFASLSAAVRSLVWALR